METVHQKTKKKPTKVEEMTKEQIRQAIVKKRECNTKAQQIVESLLERNVTDKYLLQCLPDINQAHLEDIFEERSIIHLCGYPICQKTLCIKDIPKQKYRISLKTNKVYDITARKNFCSNTCYNAAMYVKKQLLTSPLWFREYEVIPTFHLLNTDTLGGMGEEIDVTIVDRVKIADKKSFTSINDFTQASLVDVPDDALNLEGEPVPTRNNPSVAEDPSTKAHDKSSIKSMPLSSSQQEHKKDVESLAKEIIDISITTKCENLKNDNITTISNVDENLTKLSTQDKIKTSLKETATNKGTDNVARNSNRNPLNIVGEIIEKPEKKVDPILMATPSSNAPVQKKDFKKSKVLQKKQPMVTALTIEVEKCLAEWFTLDTMLLLYGEERVREMVADKGECIKEYLNNYSKGIFYSSNTYDQYQALCKKLNMLELEDRKFDSESKQDLRPLPNYSMLQEESKKMQLKVKAFFSGATDIPEPVIEETMQPISDEEKTILPLVDKNSQNALRRRIVCQYLNKVLPDLLRSLGLLSLQISADVRLLVNTFKLKANNIMFKPIQWTLIAIIFIKLLSIRDQRLEYLLEQPTAYNHMQLLLLSYKQDGGYLDRLICWLTDIDRLLDTDDTQLTIE